LLASDHLLYGTTVVGGASGFGTVFRLNADATITTLHDFADLEDNAYPRSALIQASDGNLYATTSKDLEPACTAFFLGLGRCATLFRMDLNGALTTVQTFTGLHAFVGVIQGRDGAFYGVDDFRWFEGDVGIVVGSHVFRVPLPRPYASLHTFSI